jgi:hypothetical protein
MSCNADLGAGEAAAINNRSMIELIRDDEIVGLGKGRNHPNVCSVAR